MAPRIDDERRTRGVRIALDADDLVAAAGGFVRATLQLQREGVLTIPASAPLITGKRAVVYVFKRRLALALLLRARLSWVVAMVTVTKC